MQISSLDSQTAHYQTPEPHILQSLRRVARAVGIFEGWLSFFFTAVLTLLGAIGPALFFNWAHLSLRDRVGTVGWSLAWCLLDVPYLCRFFLIAMRNRKPYALTAAVERSIFPLLVRPFIVVWWLSHFAVGAIGAAMLHAAHVRSDDGNDLFLSFGVGLAANGFLMLAVCAATNSAPVRVTVWKLRLVVDIIFALIGVIIDRSSS